MDSDAALDYATFQFSPRRTRCELFISGNGEIEKVASGFLKPFTTHLKTVEEQVAQGAKSVKLEVERRRNGGAPWFNKATLERFIRFVSTPEVLELVNSLDAEMTQLEGARRIYSQGAGDSHSATFGENESTISAAADITKKELLKAIDVRLLAVKQDLAAAYAQASSAGFTLDSVSELLLFADYFSDTCLIEACTKFISLCQRRSDLISCHHLPLALAPQLKNSSDMSVRSSSGSDMSIDEPEAEPIAAAKPTYHGPRLEKSNNSKLQQLNTSDLSDVTEMHKPIKRHPVDKTIEKVEQPLPSSTPVTGTLEQTGGSSRRLSVQDRINLFESKQKEQTTSSSSVSTVGAVSKAATSRGEHRRLPSDVSEKSVLRRWSGASDMSIDINISSNSINDRKEGVVSTPISVDLHHQLISKCEETEAAGLTDTATSQPPVGLKEKTPASSFPLPQSHFKGVPRDKVHSEDGTTKTSARQSKQNSEMGQVNNHLTTSSCRQEFGGLNDQGASSEHQRGLSDVDHNGRAREFAKNHAQFKMEDHLKGKDLTALESRRESVLAVSDEQLVTRRGLDGSGFKDQHSAVSQMRSLMKKADIEDKAKFSSDSQKKFKSSSETSTESDDLASQVQRRMFSVNLEEAGGINASGQDPFLPFSDKRKGADSSQRTKFSREASSDFIKLHSPGEGEAENERNTTAVYPLRKDNDTSKRSDFSTYPMEKVQVARSYKGNQEFNDELQTKANELEKLFAAHKLRIQNDQTASSKRSKPADLKENHVHKAVEKKQSIVSVQFSEANFKRGTNSEPDVDTNLFSKMADCEYGITNQEPDIFCPSDEFKGKFYEKYRQKRDAKLREEWRSKRAEKETKMKAMHDSLERSQAEMRAKFAGSADRQSSNYSRHHGEKIKPFSSRSGLRNQDELVIKSFQDEEADIEQATHCNDLFSYSSSKGSDTKKPFPATSVTSLTPRSSVTLIPKPSTKSSISASTKRNNQTENPLADSVANFSDFRKENTKPSTATSRMTNRSQTKNFSRSKSIIEETNLVKEDKTRRSQSMRRSIACTGELKDFSTLNLDNANFITSKLSKEQTNSIKAQKGMESKLVLRKSNGIRRTSGAGLVKPKENLISETSKNTEASEAIAFQLEDFSDAVRLEEFERTSVEENVEAIDFRPGSDTEHPRQNQEFESFDDPESENGDIESSMSQAVCDSTIVPSKLATPGESPRSWNSNVHPSLAYANETSDIDASVDSPIGSPASWKSHPLNQMMEADAAHMRKKWGSAQIPLIVANASQQPRKDVTKGFKRLLKFGRKNRGVENFTTDWVSSTASEGDDDTEDGRDMATRPSDDFRKSRMGFLHPPDVTFTEGDIYPEQVHSLRSSIPNPPANFKLNEDHISGSSLKAPRSFFSISSFRSKGSDPKLR